MNITAINIRKRLSKLRERVDLKNLNPTEKAEKHQDSLRAAVNAKCFVCVNGAEEVHTWLDSVRYCCVFDCPLHAFRPVKPIQEIAL